MTTSVDGRTAPQKRDERWRSAFIGSVIAMLVLSLSVEYLPGWLFRGLSVLVIIAILVTGLRTPARAHGPESRP